MSISPVEVNILIVIGLIMIPISYCIWKTFQDDYKEHLAIDEALGEHTPY